MNKLRDAIADSGETDKLLLDRRQRQRRKRLPLLTFPTPPIRRLRRCAAAVHYLSIRRSFGSGRSLSVGLGARAVDSFPKTPRQRKACSCRKKQISVCKLASKNLHMRRPGREETKLTAMTKGFCPSTDLIAQRTDGRGWRWDHRSTGQQCSRPDIETNLM